MNPVERYRAALDDTKAPDTLKEKLLAIPAQYPMGAGADTNAAVTDDTIATQPAMPDQTLPQGEGARTSKQIPFGKAIHFTLPNTWKKQALTAAACFLVGVFATDALGWQVVPRMGSSGSDGAMNESAAYPSTTTTSGEGGISNDMEFDTMDDASADFVVAPSDKGSYDTDAVPTAEDALSSRSVNDVSATSRKIIYTTDLTLESKAYDDTLTALTNAVENVGGYLEYSEHYNDAGSGNERSAHFTYRIPADQYTTFLNGVGEVGNIVYQSESANDVTSSYLDLQARITTLTQQRDRLWDLQEQAENLTDLLEIEATLTDVLYEIESYQSKLNFLADQVDFSTVQIYLEEVIEFTVQEPTVWDIISRTFTRGLSDFAYTIGDIFLTILSLWAWIALALVAIFVYHRARKSKGKKPNQPTTTGNQTTE